MKYVLLATLIMSSFVHAEIISYVEGSVVADCYFFDYTVEVLNTTYSGRFMSSPYSLKAEEGTYDIKCTIYNNGLELGSDIVEDVYLPPNGRATVNFDITTE